MVEHRRIVVVFQDNKLARIEGDVVTGRGSATDGGVKLDKPAPAPAKAADAPPASPKPKPAIATPPAPEASILTTTSGEPVTAGGASVDAAGGAVKPKEEKPGAEKPQEERGFFGRMLERLGF